MLPGLLALAVFGLGPPAAPALADGPGVGKPWIVSVGDSYISGEAGRWAGNTNVTPPDSIDALGPTAYFDNAGDTGELIPGCHRSKSAEVHIGGGVLGYNLACSGAQTTTTINSDGQFKPGLDFYSGSAGQGQALMLEQFARTHNVKLIPVSIGGNDFGFGDIVTTCVEDYLTPFFSSPVLCKDDASVQARIDKTSVTARTAAIEGAILNVHRAMRTAGYGDGAYTIDVQDYEAPIPPAADFRYPALGTGVIPGRPRQTIGGCGFNDADADWALGTVLPTVNATVQRAALETGLSNVRLLDLAKAFDGRELCAKSDGLLEDQKLASWTAPGAADKSEWINQIRIVTIGTPFFQQESLHPNYWGQLALRSCVRQAWNAGRPRGGVCTIAGAGLDPQGEPRMRLSGGLSPTAPSPSAGNANGGSPARAFCPGGAVLTGVTLHMNGSAGSVTGICRPLLFLGGSVSLGAATTRTTRIGRTGARDATASCPAADVVTGFTGRSGLLVDAINLDCAKLGPDGSLGLRTTTGVHGGAGGSPFGQRACTHGIAVGLFGRSGHDLDLVGLECATLS